MMPSSPRFARVKFAATTASLLGILGGITLIGLSLTAGYAGERIQLIAAGGLGVVLGLAVLATCYLLLKIESNTNRMYNQVLEIHDLAGRQCELLLRIADNTTLSDDAKSLANRELECQALRNSIRNDLRTEAWDAALYLVAEMERRFGYTEEAAALRREVIESRTEAMRRKLAAATRVIEVLFDARDWEKAGHEIERLHRALPDEPRVAKLSIRLEQEKQTHKSSLLEEWHLAVKRNDIDKGISILSELDQYLTRPEAANLQNEARSVFKAKLLQLGTQFQFAVREKRWLDALEVGMQISEEFPNSKMAHEVTERMPDLRRRAGLDPDVEVIATARDRTHPGGAASSG